MGHITVINPNSTEAVTHGMSGALDPLRMPGGPSIECVTLHEGPAGIESQADVERVVPLVVNYVSANSADAYVLGCYSDPGLFAAREATTKPVFGIAECAMSQALTTGERFGVISILAKSIPRHLRYVRQMGLNERFAADLPIGLGVTELTDDERVLERMSSVGTELRDDHGADVLIMGCAGMARFQPQLEAAVGLPVIEPTRAATTLALGAVQFRGNRG